MTITIANFTTISGHFFANCMSIVHKTEVQMVILVYSTGMVLKCSFISCYILKVSQACPRPPSTSEAIMSEPIKM